MNLTKEQLISGARSIWEESQPQDREKTMYGIAPPHEKAGWQVLDADCNIIGTLVESEVVMRADVLRVFAHDECVEIVDAEEHEHPMVYCSDGHGFRFQTIEAKMVMDEDICVVCDRRERLAWLETNGEGAVRCPYLSRAQGYRCDQKVGHDPDCSNKGDGFASGYIGSTAPGPVCECGCTEASHHPREEKSEPNVGCFFHVSCKSFTELTEVKS